MKLENRPNLTGAAEITIQYLDEDYQKIVKPGQLLLIPNYFIDHWVQRLGPTLAWIVVSLQQAYWRSEGDYCIIAQQSIAEEIGIHRHTVSKELRTNPWRDWHIPRIEYQPGTSRDGQFYRPPNRYELYEPTPLIPEHQTGLYAYLQAAEDPGQALDALLNLKPREALAHLEQQAAESDWKSQSPLAVKTIIHLATGLDPQALPERAAQLEYHLRDIGKSLCRQYFRREWVRLLGPSLAWLVMILRSRCYYNLTTGELRDTHTWQKKDLVRLLGQGRNNLQRLLAHQYADHFIQIINQRKRTLTVRVAMRQEPLTTESADQFWRKQPPLNAPSFDSAPSETHHLSTQPSPLMHQSSTQPPPNAPSFDSAPDLMHQSSTQPPINAPFFDNSKYFKQIPNDVKIPEEQTIQHVADELKNLLTQAGLSGPGLTKLCNKKPALELQKARAVVLYAEANDLGPGYVYRHLENDDPVDPLFLQFAALEAGSLVLFRQALTELQSNGLLFPNIQTPIPEEAESLFAEFARLFAGIDREVSLAALRQGRAGMEQNPDAAPEPAPRSELDLFWERVLLQLQIQTTQNAFDTWIKDTRLTTRDGPHFTVGVKNSYVKDWLENRLYSIIHRTITRLIQDEAGEDGPDIEIAFVVEEDQDNGFA